MSEKVRLSILSVLIYVVVSGYATQIGLLTGPIATAYGIDISTATASFSMLTGGFLAGTFIAYFLLDHMGIKITVLGYCLIVFLATVGIIGFESYLALPLLLGLIGTTIGVSTCIAGVIISRTWSGKPRESFFIGLDASYNLGGFLFPFLTTYILLHQFHWSLSLLVAASITVVIALLAIFSKFSFDSQSSDATFEGEKTEWNRGIVVAAISLFLVIFGKFCVILWLPQYAQNTLSIGTEGSGKLISAIFSTALVGNFIGMYIVTKIKLIYFIGTAVLIGFLSSFFFVVAINYASLIALSAVFGLAVSCLYNVFVVYGLSFVSRPSHKHISAIIVSSGVSAAIAPYASSLIVDCFGAPIAALYTTAAAYGLALAILTMFGIFGLGNNTVVNADQISPGANQVRGT